MGVRDGQGATNPGTLEGEGEKSVLEGVGENLEARVSAWLAGELGEKRD